MRRRIEAYWLGRVAYDEAHALQRSLVDARIAGRAGDTLLLLEHDAVITLGRGAKPENVLASEADRAAKGVSYAETGRGGDVTFHGPGQLVAYPLLDLKRLKLGVRDYVCKIEQAVIDTLADWNIHAARKDGAPGVYVNGAKIASLGIRVRRGCTFHGLAFNIAGESTPPFARINPCGYAGLQVVALADLGGPSALAAVKPALLAQLGRQLGLAWRADPAPPVALAG